MCNIQSNKHLQLITQIVAYIAFQYTHGDKCNNLIQKENEKKKKKEKKNAASDKLGDNIWPDFEALYHYTERQQLETVV